MRFFLPLLLLATTSFRHSQAQEQQQQQQLTCSLTNENERDPALHEMVYDVGDGEETTLVYVEPDIASFYQGPNPPASSKVTPKFNGFQGKFINLSNQRVTLYWEDKPGGTRHVMRSHQPFTASGTATFPGHRFFFTPADQPDTILQRFVVGDYPENIYYYDPYTVEGNPKKTEANLQVLNADERQQYDRWRKTLAYDKQYRAKTGRSYLANYLRQPPMHHMWRADYFGQEHWVTTRETHFTQMPPDRDLEPILVYGKKRLLADNQPRLLEEYRDASTNGILNMTLKALSCAPRAFEIENFLSEIEVQHILKIAAGVDLKLSSTGDIGRRGQDKDDVPAEDNRRTRTSYNSWVSRETSPIIDAIYRRAADLQRVDESLMRHRDADERPDVKGTKPLTEQLQLVHYDVGQEYTGHHDFGFAGIDDDAQGARFSTLLLYLNDENLVGGATSFPRYSNAETFRELRVEPKAGKAVLFYSQLPDGNMDDLSHHAAMPVMAGEKWLINLWFWDPVYD